MLYAGNMFEVALIETIYHHGRFMRQTSQEPGWTSQFREIVLKVDGAPAPSQFRRVGRGLLEGGKAVHDVMGVDALDRLHIGGFDRPDGYGRDWIAQGISYPCSLMGRRQAALASCSAVALRRSSRRFRISCTAAKL